MGDITLCVGGRLCLFGEHSDWAGEYRKLDDKSPIGYTLIAGTDQKIYASVGSLSGRLRITSTLANGEVQGPCDVEMDERILRDTARHGEFFSYCAGVAAYVKRNYDVDGLHIENHRTDLPIRKGLASSAAICVLIAKAFNAMYNLKLSIRGEMEVAYQGEIMTSSRCGRMDQACAYGSTPSFLTFDGDLMDVETIYPKRALHIVIVDLNRPKNTRRILSDLQSHYSDIGSKTSKNLQKALGELNKGIITQAKEAIELGNCGRIGELMCEAQRIFDRYVAPACPTELDAPRLHEVLRHPDIQSLIWGGKGVGSQGDGSAQFLARGADEQTMLMKKLRTEFDDISCLALTVPEGSEPTAPASQNSGRVAGEDRSPRW